MHLLSLFQELGEAESLGTVALTGVFYEPCMNIAAIITGMNITAVITGRRKPKSLEKTCLSVTFITTNLTWTTLYLEAGN